MSVVLRTVRVYGMKLTSVYTAAARREPHLRTRCGNGRRIGRAFEGITVPSEVFDVRSHAESRRSSVPRPPTRRIQVSPTPSISNHLF